MGKGSHPAERNQEQLTRIYNLVSLSFPFIVVLYFTVLLY